MGVTALGSLRQTHGRHPFHHRQGAVDDVNRPGQAFAYFLRSPHAHATIDKVDFSAAR